MNPNRIFPRADHAGKVCSFWDTERKVEYRRIFGGLSWPREMFPGFAVLVAEDQSVQHFQPQHELHTLVEIEASSTTELLNRCNELSVFCNRWYGDLTNRANYAMLCDFNRQQRKSHQAGFSLSPAAFSAGEDLKPALEYGIRRIIERTAPATKTLFLAETPKTKASFLGDTADIARNPALAALCFAVGALDRLTYVDPVISTGRVSSYDPLHW
jgi:hypothetical protein